MIDLCDEDTNVVTQPIHTVGYQYPPNHYIPNGIPQFTLPPPPMMVATPNGTNANPFSSDNNAINTKKSGLVTPPPINTQLNNNSSVSSAISENSLSTPTNIDIKEPNLDIEIQTKKDKSGSKSSKKQSKHIKKSKKHIKHETKHDNKVVNNKMNIKPKHAGLFESLLTPKTASNSTTNSNIISRVLQQPTTSNTQSQYQKLESITPSKSKKHKEKTTPIKNNGNNSNKTRVVPIPMVPTVPTMPTVPVPQPIKMSNSAPPNTTTTTTAAVGQYPLHPFPLMHGPHHMIPIQSGVYFKVSRFINKPSTTYVLYYQIHIATIGKYIKMYPYSNQWIMTMDLM